MGEEMGEKGKMAPPSAGAARLKTPEQQVKEFHPRATIEYQQNRAGGGYFLIRKVRCDCWPLAAGNSRAQAWKNALRVLQASPARSAPESPRGSIPKSPSEAGTLPASTPTPNGGPNG